MRISLPSFTNQVIRLVMLLAIFAGGLRAVHAQGVVPGTGQQLTQLGDDFEDPEWEFVYNLPKSSRNINNNDGGAGGESKNDRWYEGVKRGQPDIIRRIPTPAGGLPGSEGALLLQSLYTGIPRAASYRMQQDDFIANVHYKLGGSIPIWQSPNVVVRVFMPPVDKWEDRTGPSFAFRVALDTTVRKSSGRGVFSRSTTERETYWPGMFVEFEDKTNSGRDYDTAHLRIRANRNGGDFKGPQITQTGWWTMGISVTPDGMVHYYAKPGLEDLTAEDHITSQYPYGYRAERFKTFFFNVCSADDGKTWSTPWVIDEAEVYYIAR